MKKNLFLFFFLFQIIFVPLFSAILGTTGIIVFESCFFASLLVVILMGDKILLYLLDAVPLIGEAKIFKTANNFSKLLYRGPEGMPHIYVSRKVVDNFFIVRKFGIKSIIIGKKFRDFFNDSELEVIIAMAMTKLRNSHSVLEIFGVLFMFILHIPRVLIEFVDKKYGSNFYQYKIVIGILLAPLLIFEKKLFNKEEDIKIYKSKLHILGIDEKRFDDVLRKLDLFFDEEKDFSPKESSNIAFMSSTRGIIKYFSIYKRPSGGMLGILE